MSNKTKRVAIIAISLISIFIALTIYSIINNEVHVPNVDQIKINMVKKTFSQIYQYKVLNSETTEPIISKIMHEMRGTILSDVILYLPVFDKTSNILVIAYWENIYKNREFFIVLYKNGDISSKEIKK